MVKPAFIFDGRNVLDHAALREVGGRLLISVCDLRYNSSYLIFPLPALPQIGFIVYGLGKPLDPFIQKRYD